MLEEDTVHGLQGHRCALVLVLVESSGLISVVNITRCVHYHSSGATLRSGAGATCRHRTAALAHLRALSATDGQAGAHPPSCGGNRAAILFRSRKHSAQSLPPASATIELQCGAAWPT